MSEFNPPLSFRVKPIHIEIGPEDDREKIKIKDLSYAEHKAMLGKIYGYIFDTGSLPVVIENIGGVLKQRFNGKEVDPLKAVDTLIGEIKNRILDSGDKIVKELLNDLTHGQIVGDKVESMQTAEMLGLLVFLLERHFEALKNFGASLTSILPQKRNEQK